jgi:hypothetical protein
MPVALLFHEKDTSVCDFGQFLPNYVHSVTIALSSVHITFVYLPSAEYLGYMMEHFCSFLSPHPPLFIVYYRDLCY